MQTQSSDDILGGKKLNYEFLLLVREKKYPQALTLGRKILQTDPNNPAVQKFCSFIEKNNTELVKMVEQEQAYESYDEQDDEQNQDQSSSSNNQAQRKSQNQSKSQSQDDNDEQEQDEQEQEEEIEAKEKKEKIQLTTCTLNQIPHICPRHHKKIIQNMQVDNQKIQVTMTTESSEKQVNN